MLHFTVSFPQVNGSTELTICAFAILQYPDCTVPSCVQCDVIDEQTLQHCNYDVIRVESGHARPTLAVRMAIFSVYVVVRRAAY